MTSPSPHLRIPGCLTVALILRDLDALRIARGLNLGLPDVQRMERAKANDNHHSKEIWQ